MPRSSGNVGGSAKQGSWVNTLILAGFLFALLGYVWVDADKMVSTTLMLTGLVVGVLGMFYSIKQERE